MKTLSADYLHELGTKIFTACGAPPAEARIVAQELVQASLMGLEGACSSSTGTARRTEVPSSFTGSARRMGWMLL